MRQALTLVLVTMAVVAAPRAAEKTAWFGIQLPPPLSDPRKPIMKYDDAFGPLPTAFVHRPGKSDELLDGLALKADQKRIVGFSLESLRDFGGVDGNRRERMVDAVGVVRAMKPSHHHRRCWI